MQELIFFLRPAMYAGPLNRNGLSVRDQLFRVLDLMLTVFGMKNYSECKESLRVFDTSLSLNPTSRQHGKPSQQFLAQDGCNHSVFPHCSGVTPIQSFMILL